MERVWQMSGLSSSNDQFMKLKKALMLINQAGFNVGFGIFGNKRVSCPAEIEHYAIINWDGNVYKCIGRTLIPKDSVGIFLIRGKLFGMKINKLKESLPQLSKMQCVLIARCYLNAWDLAAKSKLNYHKKI